MQLIMHGIYGRPKGIVRTQAEVPSTSTWSHDFNFLVYRTSEPNMTFVKFDKPISLDVAYHLEINLNAEVESLDDDLISIALLSITPLKITEELLKQPFIY
jgi:hypothetical protein